MPVWLLKALHWLGLTNLSDVEVEWYADLKRFAPRDPVIERTTFQQSSQASDLRGPASCFGLKWDGGGAAVKDR